MSQSLSNILVHVIFSTKGRKPLLGDAWRSELHSYIGGIVRRLGGVLLSAGSVDDHIHLMLSLPRTKAISKVIQNIKTGSTRWIRDSVPLLADSRWQNGYGAFSVSPSHKEPVIDYIEHQREHHRKWTYKEELLKLFEQNLVVYDERYIWD